MKSLMKEGMLLFVMAVSLVCTTGCDEKKDDNTPLLTILAATAQTWEIVAPANGATDVSITPTFIFKSNCELDTAYDIDDDYAELSWDSGTSTARLSTATCDPVTIDGDTVTMILDSSVGSYPTSTVFGPLVIHGFRCKSPRLSQGEYPFNDYSFTTE